MKTKFETYQPRTIRFESLVDIDGWQVKVYTITNLDTFSSESILHNGKGQLCNWLRQVENSELPTYKQAFLIVHEAREGVWILLNWWTGGEMIESKVFFSNFDTPKRIEDSPYNTSSLLCVWELEVFAHERASWIAHILNKPSSPDFLAYQNDILNVQI